MIVTGIALFIYKDDEKSKESDLEYWGNILIGISLLMDGLKGAAQDVMRDVKRPSSMNFMFFENGWSTLLLSCIVIANGEGIAFIQFCMRHQIALKYVGIVMFCSVIGQFFISSMITNFGSLPTFLTTTMRKFFTVLFSVVIFKHQLIVRQWIATGLIFTALLLDVIFSRKKDSEEYSESENETENLKGRKNVMEMNNKVSPA
jgi:solute carrier family 35 (UDP-galactose transporter), member B1